MKLDKLPEHFEGRSVYERMMGVLIDFRDITDLQETVHPDFVGFGSAAHELFKTRADMKKMARKQADQLQGQDFRYTRKAFAEKLFANEMGCLILEEFELFFPGNDHQLRLRLSTVLEKWDGKWVVTHFHGSSPDSDIAEDEAFPELGLRRKNEELEAKIKERTRDLEIEASLERVRTRAMAMQSSEELNQLIGTMFRELTQLELLLTRCLLMIFDEKTSGCMWWMANSEKPEAPANYWVQYHDHKPYLKYINAWKKREEQFTYSLEGEEKKEWDTFLFKETDLKDLEDQVIKGMKTPEKINLSASFNAFGCLSVASLEPLPKEQFDLLLRFARVFDQTYKRFNDLQKAEAQAREALVELSLERIRAQVTAMNESADLLDIVVTLRSEFLKLGHEAHYFWHMRWLPDKYDKAMTSGDGTRIGNVMELPRHMHGDIPELAAWEKSHSPTTVFTLDAENAIAYVDKMVALGNFKQIDPQAPSHEDIRDIGGLTFVMARTTHGEIGYSLPGVVPHPPGEDLKTLVRFAGVFDLAYRRFEDLKESERQKREAEIELALERVRARTMGMQHSNELAAASQLLDQEVRALGIETWGCAFHIYEEIGSMEWFSSKAGIMDAYPVPREKIFKRYYEKGRQDIKLYKQSFEGETCRRHYEYLCTLPVLGGLLKGIVEAGGSFPENQYDHVAYFKYGYLLFITLKPVEPEVEKVFVRFAEVFEQTYTRFLDLLVKEEQAAALQREKQRLEKTLQNLQATQTQLIHAEKMASLGELTAGIAHEIQNPLNFVNNFSEVSAELLEEMTQELDKGEMEEVRAIAQDLRQNLDKITHHGKRADGIVKGMLQHSRNNDGNKESTDLNKLTDEYLRLAYHGLRAKDKSFNAAMEADLDPTLPKVEIVPQDIGRVILNLLTNAFHAVAEKKRHTPEEFEPKVRVRTRKKGKFVEIAVIDNGNGVPDRIREKIFQPFFSTKPTGQGTGLGLSMSYDIVTKGHGGDLRVASEMGKGTIFSVVLPLDKTRKKKNQKT